MAYLLDATILGRLANTKDPLYTVAAHAVSELHQRGETLHLTAQNLIEFRNVATRPAAVNGLGLPLAIAELKTAIFEGAFSLLEESRDIFPTWKALVAALGVIGKQVHDARLVAICHVHAVTHLMTFNYLHFVRLTGFGPKVVVVDPATV